MAKVVVGVDGSQESHKALEWALGEAEARGADVVVVHCYAHGPSDIPDTYLADAGRLDEARAAARREAEQVVEQALKEAGAESTSVTVTRELIGGVAPAPALIEQSKDADVLVVGSRGLGGFAGMVLGSVSQHCVQHAACPVVVFRTG